MTLNLSLQAQDGCTCGAESGSNANTQDGLQLATTDGQRHHRQERKQAEGFLQSCWRHQTSLGA